MNADIRPFRIAIGDDVLQDLQDRLRNTRWPDPGWLMTGARVLLWRGFRTFAAIGLKPTLGKLVKQS